MPADDGGGFPTDLIPGDLSRSLRRPTPSYHDEVALSVKVESFPGELAL
jgi:hypothetical protein